MSVELISCIFISPCGLDCNCCGVSHDAGISLAVLSDISDVDPQVAFGDTAVGELLSRAEEFSSIGADIDIAC